MCQDDCEHSWSWPSLSEMCRKRRLKAGFLIAPIIMPRMITIIPMLRGRVFMEVLFVEINTNNTIWQNKCQNGEVLGCFWYLCCEKEQYASSWNVSLMVWPPHPKHKSVNIDSKKNVWREKGTLGIVCAHAQVGRVYVYVRGRHWVSSSITSPLYSTFNNRVYHGTCHWFV